MKTLTRAVLTSCLFMASAALAQDTEQMPNIQMKMQVEGDGMSSTRITVQGMDPSTGEQNVNVRVRTSSTRTQTRMGGEAAQSDSMPPPREEPRENVREERSAQRDPGLGFRNCGTTFQDPGCTMQRDGQYPMDATTFRGVIQSLKGTSNELVRKDTAEKMLQRNYLTALQFGQILDLFQNELTRLEVAKDSAAHVVDPQHALGFSAKWKNSLTGQEYTEAISGQ